METWMFSGKRHVFIEAVILLGIMFFSGWCGWKHLAAIDDAHLLRETKTLPIPVLPGAVHFALGRGVGVAHEYEEGFPELEAFLKAEISEIPREAWPDSGNFSRASGHFLYMHYYLISYLGSVFYLFGISTWSFRLACVLLHVFSMLAAYGLFRLVTGRVLSLLLTVALSMSQAYLVMLVSLRDMSKAPFILGAVWIMASLVARSISSRGMYYRAALLGLLIGLGYGFRQDVFVCLPLALFFILVGARISSDHPRRTRAVAALLMTGVFFLVAAPVFKGNREVGNTITVHTLFQGLMRCSEDNAQFYSESYDFGFLNYDHPVTAQIRGYAKRTGDIYPLHDLTPAYGEVGGRMFRDFVLNWPGDLAGRVVAVLDSLSGIFATPFIWPDIDAQLSANDLPLGRPFLEHWQQAADNFLRDYGTVIILGALAFLAARSYKAAFFAVLFLGYFSAYPSTLYEYRHYFYLALVPLLFAGMLVTLMGRGCILLISRRGSGFTGRGVLYATLRGIAFIGALVIIVAIGLYVTRVYQRARWEVSLDTYSVAGLDGIPLNRERSGDKVRLLLKQSMVEYTGQSQPADGEVAAFYLAARFHGGERTVSFTLLNNNPVFTRTCSVVLRSGGVFFFPVYDYGDDTPFLFQGIEMDYGDMPLFEGLYWFKGSDVLRFWPYVFVPENRKEFSWYKSGRLDRLFSAFLAEAKGGFGLWPDKALAQYIDLLARYPFDNIFARRALNYAWCVGTPESLAGVWETIGNFMPSRRLEAAAWFAKRAEGAIPLYGRTEAIRLYGIAFSICPDNERYQENIGNLQEAGGEYSQALETYESLLTRHPENPSIAYRLQVLYEKMNRNEDASVFWTRLAADNPDATTPLFYRSVLLEEMGALKEAAELFGTIPESAPLHLEALFRQGTLFMRLGDYNNGVNQLVELQADHSEFTARTENALVESALRLMDNGEYPAAVTVYEALSRLRPDSLDTSVNLGIAYRLVGERPKAQSLFESLLSRHPECEAAAKELDAVYALDRKEAAEDAKKVLDIRAEDFWHSLILKYPEQAVPYLYMGSALERADKLQAATEAYTKALAINPEFAPVKYRLGAVSVALGDLERGIALIKQAAATDPALSSEISRRCDELAAYCIEHKRYDAARRSYETALEVSPEDLWPRVHWGELYETLGDFDAALSCYREVLMAVPDSPVTAKKMNDLLENPALDDSKAVTVWRAIVEKHPDAAIPTYYLGTAMQDAGDVTSAVAAYKRALELNPELSEAREKLSVLESAK